MHSRLDDEMQVLVRERRLEALDDGDRFIVGVAHPEYQLDWRRVGLTAEGREVPEEIRFVAPQRLENGHRGGRYWLRNRLAAESRGRHGGADEIKASQRSHEETDKR